MPVGSAPEVLGAVARRRNETPDNPFIAAFVAIPFGGPLITLSNGSQWKVQGEWSNNAYNAGTGYPNRSGQNGCLGGG